MGDTDSSLLHKVLPVNRSTPLRWPLNLLFPVGVSQFRLSTCFPGEGIHIFPKNYPKGTSVIMLQRTNNPCFLNKYGILNIENNFANLKLGHRLHIAQNNNERKVGARINLPLRDEIPIVTPGFVYPTC